MIQNLPLWAGLKTQTSQIWRNQNNVDPVHGIIMEATWPFPVKRIPSRKNEHILGLFGQSVSYHHHQGQTKRQYWWSRCNMYWMYMMHGSTNGLYLPKWIWWADISLVSLMVFEAITVNQSFDNYSFESSFGSLVPNSLWMIEISRVKTFLGALCHMQCIFLKTSFEFHKFSTYL